jgi:hypothetical protein
MRLFSYVVQHDLGYAPNPFHGYCTLAHCKFGRKRKNIVDLADRKDWVVGTGGADLRVSSGHGRLVYAMKISDILNLKQYFKDCRFRQKKIKSSLNPSPDNLQRDRDNAVRRVLIAKEFYYFGRQAVKIPERFLIHPLEKRGPGFRYRNFDAAFIAAFERWIRAKKRGVNGLPCGLTTAVRRRC